MQNEIVPGAPSTTNDGTPVDKNADVVGDKVESLLVQNHTPRDPSKPDTDRGKKVDQPKPVNDPSKKTSSTESEPPPLAVEGMLAQPFRRLDANLGALERLVPGLKASIEELKRIQSTEAALRTPEDFRKHSEAISQIEEKCCEAMAGFVKLSDILVTTFQNAQNVARYMPEEGADPHPAWWKRAINALLPYGGTGRAMNSVAGTASFLAGFIGTGYITSPLFTSLAAPLFALSTGPAGFIALITAVFAVSLATAITGIIGGGITTYAYGACNVIVDKVVAPIVSKIGSLVPGLSRVASWVWPWKSSSPDVAARVEQWKNKLNSTFASAKNRSMKIFSDVDACLRSLADLRDTIPTLCTNARADSAEKARQSENDDHDEWKKTDDQLYGEAVQSEKETRENKELIHRFDGLQKLTGGVEKIDPDSMKDKLNRGFQGAGDICGLIKELGEAHFFFPGGMPKTQPFKLLYILLGILAGPVAKFGRFAQALASDGAKPIRMLHELLGVILAKLRLKKQEGITTKDLLLAAFNQGDWEKHGPLYYFFGGAMDLSLATGVKTIPLIELANEMRELSPSSARLELHKKMGDIHAGKHAVRSTFKSIFDIVGDAASVAGSTCMNGLRRMFQRPRERMVGAETRAQKASAEAQTAVSAFVEKHPWLRVHEGKTNAQLGDDIRTQLKALHHGDTEEAERIETLIEYWEMCRTTEDSEREQLNQSHSIELHDIHPDLPGNLEALGRTRNSLIEGTIQTLKNLPEKLETLSEKKYAITKYFFKTLKGIASGVHTVVDFVARKIIRATDNPRTGDIRQILKDLPAKLDALSEQKFAVTKYFFKTLKGIATGSNIVLGAIGSRVGRVIEVLATPVTGGSHFLTVARGDQDPKALANVEKTSQSLARLSEETFAGLSFGETETIVGSTPLGALLVLRNIPADDGKPSHPQVTLVAPEEAHALIQRHIQEKKSLPAALLSDEPTLQILARHAVGRPGALPRSQRDALRQMQIGGGDLKAAGPRMELLFSKAEREGFTGPDDSVSVPGLQHLFSVVRKRRAEVRQGTRARLLMGD